ncbi:MAG TPA: hypothetical protein VM510_16875, partial [Caulifigura sp.]|nr:hypothetical protein [Caulifigura sp.]
PAIAVTRTAVGHLGSVVIWQQLCGLVQVMDPLSGRRWLSRKALIDQLYCHSQEVEADALSSWMRTAAFEWPLEVRLQELGIPEAHTLIANAACEPRWRGIATLDAVVREVAAGGGGRQTTASNRHLVLTNWKRALVDLASVPGQFWFARVHADGVLRISGAVILRFQLREKHCRV